MGKHAILNNVVEDCKIHYISFGDSEKIEREENQEIVHKTYINVPKKCLVQHL